MHDNANISKTTNLRKSKLFLFASSCDLECFKYVYFMFAIQIDWDIDVSLMINCVIAIKCTL